MSIQMYVHTKYNEIIANNFPKIVMKMHYISYCNIYTKTLVLSSFEIKRHL